MPKLSGFVYPFRPAAVISVWGEDSFTFLQGQFTQDLRGPVGTAVYGLWLSEKGKVMADSVLCRRSDTEFRGFSWGSSSTLLTERFQKYIVADDVALCDATPSSGGLLIWGAAASASVEQWGGGAVGLGRFVERDGVFAFPSVRLPDGGIELIGPLAEIARLQAAFRDNGMTEVDRLEVERQRVAAGVPAIPTELGPTDLPNEAGLEDTAISFTKGCYLGQEVMARLKNLGQVRRQLTVVHGTGAPPVSGTLLYHGVAKVGEMRSAFATAEGFVGMAMLLRTGVTKNAGLSFTPGEGATQVVSVWTK